MEGDKGSDLILGLAPLDSCTCMCKEGLDMGLDARKPVFGVSVKLMPKSAYSATETS